MRTAGNKAFTLIELLIVIMIIFTLATLIVPTLIRAVILARQTACNSNVQKIITGLSQYSTASQEMPKVPVTNWDTKIGKNRNTNPFNANSERNHSANLWLLARGEHVAMAAFVCPGTTDSQNEREKVEDYWDFRSGLRISYGLQSPYGHGGSLSILTPEGVVLVADGSPYVQPEGNNSGKLKNVAVVDWGSEARSFEERQLFGNSPNHDSEGQNVGFLAGHAEWKTAANCGKGGDNIYSASNDPTMTNGRGFLKDDSKNNENDTLILP